MKAYSILIFALLILMGCNSNSDKASDAEQFSKYILTQNLNIISQKDEIFVKFKTLPFDKNKISQPVVKGIINLSPKVDGEVYKDVYLTS